MAIFRCKMCGGKLDAKPNETVTVCPFCGVKQTIANDDDVRKENLYNRANSLRMKCDFDNALLAYQQIVSLFPKESEAYWGVVLCKYGIEYVDDVATSSKKPTMHRASFDSILNDFDYLKALDYADALAKEEYIKEANEIAEIQKNILAISQKERPYDIFICYKETDKNGDRTKDSVIAQDIYDKLTERGYKVFFSRISLETKVGVMYEPYIFAALNSSKIMLVLGSSKDFFESTWVKNEWSRFINLMSGGNRYLIPCYLNMDPYDMPHEFLNFQAQDLGKLGFIQDLTRGIDKIMGRDAPVFNSKGGEGVTLDSLHKRAEILLSKREWAKASEVLDKALNMNPTNSKTYILSLMLELQVETQDKLLEIDESCEKSFNYQEAMEYGDGSTKKFLKQIIDNIPNNKEISNARMDYKLARKAYIEGNYEYALNTFNRISSMINCDIEIDQVKEAIRDSNYNKARSLVLNKKYYEATEIFKSLGDYKDSKELINKIEEYKINDTIADAKKLKALGKFEEAIKLLEPISNMSKEASELIIEYKFRLTDTTYLKGISLMNCKKYEEAAEIFRSLGDFKNALKLLKDCEDFPKEEIYKHAVELANTNEFREAIDEFKKIQDYKDSKEYIKTLFYKFQDDYYNKANELLKNKKFDEAKDVFIKLEDFKESKLLVSRCDELKEEDRKAKIYASCQFNRDIDNDIEEIGVKKKIEQLKTIIDYSNSENLIKTYEDKLLKYKGLRAKRREEDRIKKAKLKKKITIASIISSILTVIITAVLLLTFLFFIPNSNQNKVIDLINNKNYDEASKLLVDNGDFGYSKNLSVMLNAGKSFESLDYEKGIEYILELDGTVDVNYDGNGGTVDKDKTTIKKRIITDEAHKEDYVFYGWKLTDYTLDASSYYASINLIASYTPIEYEISYDLGGGTYKDFISSYNVDESLIIESEPVKKGYTFLGWTGTDLDEMSKTITIEKGSSGNRRYVAHWKANTCRVKINLNGGEAKVTQYEVTYDSRYKFEVPTRTGYDFSCFKYGNYKLYASGTWKIDKDVTLETVFTPRNDIAYTVNHMVERLDGSFELKESEHLYGKADSTVEIVTKNYEGFHLETTYKLKINADGTSTIDVYYYRNINTVTYVTNGGDSIDSVSYKYGEKYKDVTPVRKGYTFEGWYRDIDLTEKFDGNTRGQDVTLYAYYLEETKTSYFEYKKVNNTYTITGFDHLYFNSREIIVPQYIGGCKVTSIADFAFKPNGVNPDVISIVIGNDVTEIGVGALNGCNSLQRISIPFVGNNNTSNYKLGYLFSSGDPKATCEILPASLKKVTVTNQETIKAYAFSDATNLTDIIIGDKTTAIETQAFASCTGLVNLTLPTLNVVSSSSSDRFGDVRFGCLFGTMSLGARAEDINEYLVPETLKTIVVKTGTEVKESYFEKLKGVETIELGEGFKTIRSGAFYSCYKLTTVKLPDSITEIESSVFNACSKLANINLPKSIKVIRRNLFGSNVSLTTLEIPSSVQVIEESAFSGSGLISVTIPNGVTTIGNYAFYNCSSLTSIVIPSSVTYVGTDSFYNWSSMQTIYVEQGTNTESWSSQWQRNCSARVQYDYVI